MLWQRRFGGDRGDESRERAESDADFEFASELGPSGLGSPSKTGRSTGARSKTTRGGTAKESSLMGGVSISPMPVTAGERVTVKYNGLLAQSGADALYLHTGFGPKDWRNVSDIPMLREKAGTWKADVELDPNETSRLNFCFRDTASNWDNNSGLNWSLEIHNGQVGRF